MVTVAVAPLPREPKVQTRVPVPMQVPLLAVDDRSLTKAGRVLVTVVLGAASGPLLVTVRVKVSSWPTRTDEELPVAVIARSAEAAVTLAVALSMINGFA